MPSSACPSGLRQLRPFPTRRSSDLFAEHGSANFAEVPIHLRRAVRLRQPPSPALRARHAAGRAEDRGIVEQIDSEARDIGLKDLLRDRKSTRLNSSHLGISYAVFCLSLRPPSATPFPYTTLFRSFCRTRQREFRGSPDPSSTCCTAAAATVARPSGPARCRPCGRSGHCRADRLRGSRYRSQGSAPRSEEHTSELQSLRHLVCRLLLVPPASVSYALSLHDALPIFLPNTAARISRKSRSIFDVLYGCGSHRRPPFGPGTLPAVRKIGALSSRSTPRLAI